jgi:hypothetical protein
MKVDVELENARGPNVFTIDGEEHTMERKPGYLKIWTCTDGEDLFHTVDFTDSCYRADIPVSIETLKKMRDSIDEYITGFENE